MQAVLDNADQLYSMQEINRALDTLAVQLTEDYQHRLPLVLCVMNGSVLTTGHLLPRLLFPLELDYIHASRYGDSTVGGDINWLHKPVMELEGRDIILVEDIVDEGVTLEVLRKYCASQGAKTVSCTTLIEKQGVKKQGTAPEYVGLTVPNRYVFGFGMDYKGFWRNLPAIYAVNE